MARNYPSLVIMMTCRSTEMNNTSNENCKKIRAVLVSFELVSQCFCLYIPHVFSIAFSNLGQRIEAIERFQNIFNDYDMTLQVRNKEKSFFSIVDVPGLLLNQGNRKEWILQL